jgi:hypothetical protein
MVGELSDDGKWMWDGETWISAPPPGPPPSRPLSGPPPGSPPSRPLSGPPSLPKSSEKNQEFTEEEWFEEMMNDPSIDSNYKKAISWSLHSQRAKAELWSKQKRFAMIVILPTMFAGGICYLIGAMGWLYFLIVILCLELLVIALQTDYTEIIIEKKEGKRVHKCAYCGWEPDVKWWKLDNPRNMIHKHWRKMDHTKDVLDGLKSGGVDTKWGDRMLLLRDIIGAL